MTYYEFGYYVFPAQQISTEVSILKETITFLIPLLFRSSQIYRFQYICSIGIAEA